MRVFAISLLAMTAIGCSSSPLVSERGHRALKALEGQFYNTSAGALSEYCESLNALEPNWRLAVDEERRQFAHEIRERGTAGPEGPDGYSGPVVKLFCFGDRVPEGMWPILHKTFVPRQQQTDGSSEE